MNLDIDFILYSGLLIASLIPLYFYRGKIPFISKNMDLKLFLKDLRLYLKNNHPKIPFNYLSIEKTKNQKDLKVRQSIIVDDLVMQFINFKYFKATQKSVSKDKLWTSYNEKSKANSKYPNDWKQRKELAWKRDEKICNRCGKKIELNNTYTTFVNSIENGGAYNLENIIILCVDCNKVVNNRDVKNSSLNIYEKLMRFVKS